MSIIGYFKNLQTYEKAAFGFSGFMLIGLIVLSYFHKMGGYAVETDFYWAYARDAQNILNGNMPEEPGKGPGYPLALIFVNFFFNDLFTSGKILSVLSTVLGGCVIFGIVKTHFNAKLAFFTQVLWYFTVLPYSIIASTDLFFTCIFTASIYYLFRNQKITTANLIVSALLMGCAYLTRPNAVVLPLATAFIIFLINPESWNWSKKLKHSLIFAAVFFCMNLPWEVIKSAAAQAPKDDSHLVIASHFYGRQGVIVSEDIKLAAEKFDSLKSVIFYDFKYFVKHYIYNIYHHFSEFAINSVRFPSFLFLGAGAILLLPKINKQQLSIFVFPAASFLLLCLVHYEPRYYFPVLSFAILLVVYFLFHNSEQKVRLFNKVIPYRELIFVLTALFLLKSSVHDLRANINDEPRELLEIAKELRGKVTKNASIIARKPHLPYLTDLRTIYFPMVTTIPELLEFAEKEKAEYLLYGEMASQLRPELSILLEPDKLPGNFETVYIWPDPRTIVYKLSTNSKHAELNGKSYYFSETQ